MLCQSCGKKQATFHYSSNDNGSITETHLCHDCAEKSGLLAGSKNLFAPFSFLDDFSAENDAMLGGLLGDLFSPAAPALKESAVCPFCGMRLSEFVRGGKAGCGKCYTTFKDALAPTVQKLHGNTRHIGKFPAGRALRKTKEEKRAELVRKMDEAVKAQAYEKAAEYRDKIKELDAWSDNA